MEGGGGGALSQLSSMCSCAICRRVGAGQPRAWGAPGDLSDALRAHATAGGVRRLPHQERSRHAATALTDDSTHPPTQRGSQHPKTRPDLRCQTLLPPRPDGSGQPPRPAPLECHLHP
jgi:hypothetical protein